MLCLLQSRNDLVLILTFMLAVLILATLWYRLLKGAWQLLIVLASLAVAVLASSLYDPSRNGWILPAAIVFLSAPAIGIGLWAGFMSAEVGSKSNEKETRRSVRELHDELTGLQERISRLET